jgi:hypothetical protein
MYKGIRTRKMQQNTENAQHKKRIGVCAKYACGWGASSRLVDYEGTYLSAKVYADGGKGEHSAFTVPRRVLVPLIDRVDFSTSDAEPPAQLPNISSLRRLLLVVIFSSSSSHARTALEGIRFRLVVGVVTPNDLVNGVIVAVEGETAALLPALLFVLALLLRAEGYALDTLRCRVGGMESASGVCERRFDVGRGDFHVVVSVTRSGPISFGPKDVMANKGADDGPGVGIGGGESGPALELPDVDGDGEVRREEGADFERDAFFFLIFSCAIERCSCERGASLISIGSNATSTGPEADMRVTWRGIR